MDRTNMHLSPAFQQGYHQGLEEGYAEGYEIGNSKGQRSASDRAFGEGSLLTLRLLIPYLAHQGYHGEKIEAAVIASLADVYEAHNLDPSEASNSLRQAMQHVNEIVLATKAD